MAGKARTFTRLDLVARANFINARRANQQVVKIVLINVLYGALVNPLIAPTIINGVDLSIADLQIYVPVHGYAALIHLNCSALKIGLLYGASN